MPTGRKTPTQTQSLGGEYSAQLPVRVSSQVTYICLTRITVTWSTGQPPPPDHLFLPRRSWPTPQQGLLSYSKIQFASQNAKLKMALSCKGHGRKTPSRMTGAWIMAVLRLGYYTQWMLEWSLVCIHHRGFRRSDQGSPPPRLQCGMCQANPQAVITAGGWSSAACQSYVSRPYWPVIIVLVLN